MSKCNVFGKTLSDVINSYDAFNFDLGWLNALIPRYSDSISGTWYPIYITNQNDRVNPSESFGSILTNPQNVDDASSPPCNCDTTSVGRNVSYAWRNVFEIEQNADEVEEPEDGQLCNYCEALNTSSDMQCLVPVEYRPKDGGTKRIINWPLSTPVTNPPQGESEIYEVNCCEGGCDTRMKTDDITPKIPYLYNNYIIKYQDFKYHGQFPATENPPLGYEKFGEYIEGSGYNGLRPVNARLYIDWTLKARLGEIPQEGNETYHINTYAHRKSYSRYSLNNKTCGNFILYNVNESTPTALWQKNNMPVISNLPINQPISSNTPLTGVIPSPENFTIPYGITDATHHNIFLRSAKDKHGSFWKWNYTTGIIGWYRYWDIKREKDTRPLPGIDLYISEGDVIFASNDGPEPNSVPISSAGANSCTPKSCPSGLKFTKYQFANTDNTVTVLPSGSDFIYISANIYPLVFDWTQLLIDLYKGPLSNTSITYKEVLFLAAEMATGPRFSQITVDLLKFPLQYTAEERQEFVNIINKITNDGITIEKVNEWLDNYDWRRESGKLYRDLTHKNMPSYNDLNMISSRKSLAQTLISKYGCYFWIPPKSISDIFITKTIPQHASMDIDFEPVVKYSDTFCSIPAAPKLTCESVFRGSTKVFAYDQNFSIGESYIQTKIFDDQNQDLVYRGYCVGNPPAFEVTDVSPVMSIYYRDKRIFSQAYGNYNTSFETWYSRFPSVSSTLDDTFTTLSDVADANEDTNVFFLKPDRLLRFKRHYRGFGANPSVDLVGFHQQGGCYYDSTLLNRIPNSSGTVAFLKNWKPSKTKYEPKISFKTYDVGIKLYSIHSELLRDSRNLDCRTLPLDQTCGCWGLDIVENYPYKCSPPDTPVVYETPDLYTPYLSTESVPALSYGGYDEQKVGYLLGNTLLPNHPSPGSLLPEISKPLDALNMNGCTETYIVELPNWVATRWVLQIPDLNTDESNIWISYTDSFGFGPGVAANRDTYDPPSIAQLQDPYFIPGPKIPRTQNRLVINGKEIFPNEQVILNAASNILEVKIYNSLVVAAFENPDQYLYTPEMFVCSNERTTSPGGPSISPLSPSTVRITIGRIPFKNILAFEMPGIQSWGKLKKSFFEPNSGLLDIDERGSSLSLNQFNGLFNFDYSYKLFNDKTTYDSPISPNHKTVSGTTELYSIDQLTRFLGAMDNSKKIRVYFKVSGEWYEYNDHRSFGYYNSQDKQQYHSWPTAFSELKDITQPARGAFIPAVPKTPLEHTFMYNTQTWVNACNDGNAQYPFFSHTCYVDEINKKKLYLDGSRAYFMFPNVKDTNNYTDRLFFEQTGTIFTNYFDEDKIPYPTTIYASGSGVIKESCVELDPLDIYLTDKVSDIYGQGLPIKDLSIPNKNKVLKKELLYSPVKYTSGNINDILVNKFNNIKTVLYMESDVNFQSSKGYIGFYYDKNKITNLTIFPTVNIKNQPVEEYIRLNKFLGDVFSSKWGDLYYYNNTADVLNNRVYYHSLNGTYGPFTHDHMFSYEIANNFSYSTLLPNEYGVSQPSGEYNIYFKQANSGYNVSIENPVISYYIHQPFSIGDSRFNNLLDRFNLYKNSLPVLDVNIYEPVTRAGVPQERSEISKFENIAQVDSSGLGITGILCFSGINRPSYLHNYAPPSFTDSNNYNFFLNLDSKFNLKPTPLSKTTNFYSQSFVVSETYNNFDGLVISSKYIDFPVSKVRRSRCTDFIIPRINIPAVGGNVYNVPGAAPPFTWKAFNKINIVGDTYQTYPIYCDVDYPRGQGRVIDTYQCAHDPSGDQCSINEIGTLSVKSRFATYEYREVPISSLPDDDIEYSLNIDAGLYCPLAPTGRIPNIVRAQFSDFSPMFSKYSLNNTSDCIDGKSYPPLERGLAVWDNLYQSEIYNNLVSLLPQDIWANEMIFRAIHGAKQKINLNTISKYNINSNNSFSTILNTLLNRPDNNIAFIYDSIPYDYDAEAELKNIQIEGSIRISGPAIPGQSIKITYNGSTYNLNIEENEEYIYISSPEFRAKGLIAEKLSKSSSIYIRERGSNATSITGPNVTEEVVDTCKSPMSFSVSTLCATEHNVSGPGCSAKLIQKCPKWTGTVCSPAGSQCPIALVSTYLYIEDTATGGGVGAANVAPCGHFSIADAKKESSGDLDGGLSKWAASWYLGGTGGGSPPNECGEFRIYPCLDVKHCCTDLPTNMGGTGRTSTKIVKRLRYRMKICHYAFTLNATISNSLWTGPRLQTVSPDVVCDDVDWSGAGKLEELKTICCDCGNNAGVPPFVPTTQPCPPGSVSSAICCKKYCEGKLSGDIEKCLPAELVCGDFECQESMWALICSSPGTLWDVVRSTTTSEVAPQQLQCSRFLALFSFHNNQIQLDLGVKKEKDGVEIFNGSNCISRKTNFCPSIRVEVPNDKYTVQNITSSKCQPCDKKTKTIKVIDNPQWQFQIDDNICILGAIVTGGSVNSLYTFGINCDVSEEDAAAYAAAGNLYQGRKCCGPAPEIGNCFAETTWHHFIGSPILGSEYKGGENKCEQSITVKGGWLINFPSYIYGATADYVDLWKRSMEEKFNSAYYCTNNYQYKADDLIEGVIPGSCALEFGGGSWPITAFKLSVKCTEDLCGREYKSESTESTLAISVAYIRYKYKHPINLGDKLIDEFGSKDGDTAISSQKCRTFYGINGAQNNCRKGMYTRAGVGTWFTNTKEKLLSTTTKNNNCAGPVKCYDNTRPCDPNNYCCQIDPFAATYLNG